MHIEPCFCGNTDPDEFIIKTNKMTCLCCNTTRISSTTTCTDDMLGVWNTRGVCPIDLDKTKALAIGDMFHSMPFYFKDDRDRSDWIAQYIHNLMTK